MRYLKFILLMASLPLCQAFFDCGSPDTASDESPEALLSYCGITMINPMPEIARKFMQLAASAQGRALFRKYGRCDVI